jgi:hypothetical protein
MAEVNYAFIKNGEVVNIAVFEYPTDAELLAHFKDEYSLDEIVLATSVAAIGWTYDGELFWSPQPYPSWVKGHRVWEAPVAKPEFDPEDPKYYEWDEATVSWVEITPAP